LSLSDPRDLAHKQGFQNHAHPGFPKFPKKACCPWWFPSCRCRAGCPRLGTHGTWHTKQCFQNHAYPGFPKFKTGVLSVVVSQLSLSCRLSPSRDSLDLAHKQGFQNYAYPGFPKLKTSLLSVVVSQLLLSGRLSPSRDPRDLAHKRVSKIMRFRGFQN
jgi:hypothetical protein